MGVLDEHSDILKETDDFEEFVKHQNCYNDVMKKIANILHDKDPKKCMLQWLKGQEDCDSDNILGFMYLYGVEVDVDKTKAMELFRRSAEQGNIIGQDSLGMIYLNGNGVEKDLDEAYKWLEMSIVKHYVTIPKSLYESL